MKREEGERKARKRTKDEKWIDKTHAAEMRKRDDRDEPKRDDRDEPKEAIVMSRAAKETQITTSKPTSPRTSSRQHDKNENKNMNEKQST